MAMEEYKFSEDHSWAKPEDGEYTVGISEFAVNELGDIIFVELPEEGSSISAGEPFGTVESAKAVEDLIAPISGEVTRINEDVIDMPEVLNEDPYAEGWMIAVSHEGSDDELSSLIDYDQYQSGLDSEDSAEGDADGGDFFSSDE